MLKEQKICFTSFKQFRIESIDASIKSQHLNLLHSFSS